MNEQEHNLTLRMNESEDFEMTRDNGHLFTFVGELATRNHVFLVINMDQETAQGMYIFAHHESYQPLAAYMVEHEYPLRLNQREVPECDESAFQNSLDQLAGSLDEGELDDWLNNGN